MQATTTESREIDLKQDLIDGLQMQALLDATQPKGRRYYWKSEYLPGIDPALCDKVMVHAAKIPSPYSAVILFQIGGSRNRLEEDHSPVGNRNEPV